MPATTKAKPSSASTSLTTISSHGVRLRCWAELAKRVASPKELTETLGPELKVTLSDIAYHVRVLRDIGAIEMVRSEPRRGATENFYRTVVRPHLTEDDLREMSTEEAESGAAITIQFCFAAIERALSSGTMVGRPDHTMMYFPTQLDAQGRRDAYEAAEAYVEAIFTAQDESAARKADDPSVELSPVTAIGFFFDSPA